MIIDKTPKGQREKDQIDIHKTQKGQREKDQIDIHSFHS